MKKEKRKKKKEKMENKKGKNIITRLQDFLESEKGQRLLNYLYSWGAAVVIAGALFKLTHIKGADLMLFIGMGTEVLVFFISGFDRQASTMGGGNSEAPAAASGPVVIGGGVPLASAIPPAGNVPPIDAEALAAAVPASGNKIDAETLTAMANLAAANAAAAAASAASHGTPSPATQEVTDATLQSPASTPEDLQNTVPTAETSGTAPHTTMIGKATTIIGEGGTVNIPEMEKVTTEYVDRLNELSEMMAHVSEQMKNLEGSADELERLNRNLTSINTIYELHLKSLGSQIGNIDNVNEQTQRMADQIEELNRVYKRMLESMTVNMGVRGATPTQPQED